MDQTISVKEDTANRNYTLILIWQDNLKLYDGDAVPKKNPSQLKIKYQLYAKPAQTLNRLSKKSANLGEEMALFSTPSWAQQPAHFFQHCWKSFVLDAQITPATAWQTEEENPCLHNIHLWAAKELNAAMADPWALNLLKLQLHDLLQWDNDKECHPTCWEPWDAKEPSSNMVPPE